MNWQAFLGGGQANVCQAGHGRHDTVQINGWEVFDWQQYEGTEGYCTGDDEVSKSIAVNGYWEPDDTVRVSDVCAEGGDGVVIDLGCHIGWFTVTAARTGREVVAVDADAENLKVLIDNANAYQCGKDVTLVRGWIGADTPAIALTVPVRLLKVDLEGNEAEAVRVFGPMLAAGTVEHVLLEVSPCFNGTYKNVLARMASWGYTAEMDGAPFGEREFARLEQGNVWFRR